MEKKKKASDFPRFHKEDKRKRRFYVGVRRSVQEMCVIDYLIIVPHHTELFLHESSYFLKKKWPNSTYVALHVSRKKNVAVVLKREKESEYV